MHSKLTEWRNMKKRQAIKSLPPLIIKYMVQCCWLYVFLFHSDSQISLAVSDAVLAKSKTLSAVSRHDMAELSTQKISLYVIYLMFLELVGLIATAGILRHICSCRNINIGSAPAQWATRFANQNWWSVVAIFSTKVQIVQAWFSYVFTVQPLQKANVWLYYHTISYYIILCRKHAYMPSYAITYHHMPSWKAATVLTGDWGEMSKVMECWRWTTIQHQVVRLFCM